MNEIKIAIERLNLHYGNFQALREINAAFPAGRITALIGPSGCGKSSLLRCLNRMNDLVPGVRVEGRIRLDGEEISRPEIDLVGLRKRVGMVFQKPNPFPLSVRENVTYGLRIHNLAPRADWDGIVEESLRRAWLWRELKDRLCSNALSLPLDQQQRLCVARLLAMKPEVLLLDEPASALDPIATEKLEELLRVLKQDYTVVIVTHNMDQAARLSDFCGFFLLGEMLEFGETAAMFRKPARPETENYITGRFG
ncbi:MAG: Phosphate import ATP-binding protein PstB 3 [candidate division TA06 bacterium ADurb.Bin417]|uniref:Phosphate import ATP-binding protein PstB 3 n=1 Tax=candidate division TA06 bacterium ADurb.Bin417 TaxID=1852828 RepID=A0A1V5MIL3_UNCT6|nr:MAG: Phosphate import ATP-binding protein PstB 3 [candidate division TA06 bacterium ADurb.Bin417]